MRIKQKTKNGAEILYIFGEINIDTSPNLKKYLNKIIRNQKKKIVLNFSDVEYVDSVGLSTLIRFQKDVNKINAVLIFSNLPPKIISIFSITKCEKVFNICSMEADALSIPANEKK